MDNSYLKKIISDFFTSRSDIFGKESTYLKFETYEPNKNLSETAPDGYRSIQLYGKVIFEDERGNTCKSPPFVIKALLDSVYHKLTLAAFTNEINFYKNIVPIFGTLGASIYSLFPNYYHGETVSDERQPTSAIIFEDLNAKGYKLAEKRSFLDFEHLALMMRKLGQFHAYSYKVKNTSPRGFYSMAKSFEETDYFLLEGKNLLKFIARRGVDALDQHSEYVPLIRKCLQNSDNIYERVLTGDDENPISVITHGDYLRNNVMFRYTENNIPHDLRLIDMATYRYASPVIDLASILYINADQTTRNKYWDKLIDEYYAALRETFPENQVPSRSAILKEFVGKSFYTYLVAAHFLPRLISNDITIPYPEHVDSNMARKFDEFKFNEIPEKMWIELFLAIGGEQGTQALRNILQDMIDRKFICEHF